MNGDIKYSCYGPLWSPGFGGGPCGRLLASRPPTNITTDIKATAATLPEAKVYKPPDSMELEGVDALRLWSDDFQHGGTIPKLFTCDDKDVSPHLAWEGVPEGTGSLALIVDDPDAPVGTWVHWLVCDIPPHAGGIPRGALPAGARQVCNDFGKVEYGGPCPPGGTHRYFHKLYALSEVLPDLGTPTKAKLEKAIEGKVVAMAELVGTYQRSR